MKQNLLYISATKKYAGFFNETGQKKEAQEVNNNFLSIKRR